MREVAADKAYLGGENLLVTLRQGAIPYIPFKSNSQIQTNYGPKSELWTRMFHFYNFPRECKRSTTTSRAGTVVLKVSLVVPDLFLVHRSRIS